jgi:hypothetical protein
LITGEITPAYSTLEEGGLLQLRAINPRVKLIYIMRDPVSRSWSAVMKLRRNQGRQGLPSVPEAIGYAKSDGVRRRSSYLQCIERIEQVFPREQIFYGFFEQLTQEPAEFTTDILQFLGAQPGDVTRLLPDAPVNAAARGRMPPPEFTRTLARDYLPWIEGLCRRFDGPPHRWKAEYKALLGREAAP